MQTNKEKFIILLKRVQRNGIDSLISYLANKTDFFTAPASTLHHGACAGGLMEHSLAVYANLLTVTKAFNKEFPPDSLIICALLHDVCKANFYRKGFRNRKNELTGQWEKIEVYEVDDRFPIGHGEKSVIILQKHITLSDDEMMAIRWHMGGFDDAVRSFGGAQCLSNAMKNYSLVVALQMADLATCYFDSK